MDNSSAQQDFFNQSQLLGIQTKEFQISEKHASRLRFGLAAAGAAVFATFTYFAHQGIQMSDAEFHDLYQAAQASSLKLSGPGMLKAMEHVAVHDLAMGKAIFQQAAYDFGETLIYTSSLPGSLLPGGSIGDFLNIAADTIGFQGVKPGKLLEAAGAILKDLAGDTLGSNIITTSISVSAGFIGASTSMKLISKFFTSRICASSPEFLERKLKLLSDGRSISDAEEGQVKARAAIMLARLEAFISNPENPLIPSAATSSAKKIFRDQSLKKVLEKIESTMDAAQDAYRKAVEAGQLREPETYKMQNIMRAVAIGPLPDANNPFEEAPSPVTPEGGAAGPAA